MLNWDQAGLGVMVSVLGQTGSPSHARSVCVDWGPYRYRPPCGRDFAVLATYFGKPNTLAIPLYENKTMHWAWEMVRVACTHPMNPSWMNNAGRWSTMLLGSADQFMFWRIRVKVDICRSGTCICRVVRNPQLGFNRFESVLLGEGDSIPWSAS